MGFSAMGLVIALAVLGPNFLLVWAPPTDGLPSARVPSLLTWTERGGQALCLVVPVMIDSGRVRWWWALPVAAGLVGYYALWLRYFASGRSHVTLYGPAWRVPVPMAILPVLVFLAAGALLVNVWLTVAALVLAVGHIPASATIARSLADD